MENKKPIMLIIMDGYGMNPNEEGNAIKAASTPNLTSYQNDYPHTVLNASGMAVGLPEGQMGNSEVGHTNIGAGRVVYQELTRITKSIQDGDFFEKEEFLEAIANCKKHGTKLHLIGLLSDGGVHSHNTHLYALLELAKQHGLQDVFVHCFFDGRDVPPNSAKGYLEQLIAKMAEIGVGKVASIMGRYFAMDRDNRWERVVRAYQAMVQGKGEIAEDAVQAVADSYKMEVYDEFIEPTVVIENDKPVACIGAHDSVIFFNFRPDRAREITKAFMEKEFSGFERDEYFPLYFVCMTQYDQTFENVVVAYKPTSLQNTFGEYISKKGLRQLRIAETEKYAHVTFFFNGGVENVYEFEERLLIPSPKVATYDLLPEMSAYEVADSVVERVYSNAYDVIIVNFANCDMVGHTGIFDAAKKAVEAVDSCVGKAVDAMLERNGIVIVTSDHGNADEMVDPKTGEAFTAHTTFGVPLFLIGADAGTTLKERGKLADIAPTMLELLGLEKPDEMTGESLIG